MYPQDLFSPISDLTTPDGRVALITNRTEKELFADFFIEKIPRRFRGFFLGTHSITFNLKSTLAQLGIEAELLDLELNKKAHTALASIKLASIDKIGKELLDYIQEGAYVGKLFANDLTRRVRDPYYLQRIFGRSDQKGEPLLSFGYLDAHDSLPLKKKEGRIIAYLPLLKSSYEYDTFIYGLLPTIGKGLNNSNFSFRELLRMHQKEASARKVKKNQLLIVRTEPLHIRTVFAKVVNEELPKGFNHTKADILQPNTFASGDIYEFYGESSCEIDQIPLEFYTLEPYKEHVFFSDRDQLKDCIENQHHLFKAFQTAPQPSHHLAATFVVKGTQLLGLTPADWIAIETEKTPFPGLSHLEKQAYLVERYIEEQPIYPYLKAIEENFIASEGILLTRYFPTPLLKRMLLSDRVQKLLKGIYFLSPSREYQEFFSHEDRSLLIDLVKFGIPVYWCDEKSQKILQFIPRGDKDTGMFVPKDKISNFTEATFIGVYGSNLIQGHFEYELGALLKGLQVMKQEMNHPLLNPKTPLALVTGGGPGAMMIGNKAALECQVLSCANIVDFSRPDAIINEQHQNPYIEAKMTYRIDRLVERQAEFHLDLPIFLTGGIGTDFEYALEEVRRKVGASLVTPILLFGSNDYWVNKITSRYQQNLQCGTIEGSEWISNCFYVVRDAKEALSVYRKFFSGQLDIGPNGPTYLDGFLKSPGEANGKP
ncbi:MAG: hypothetical protein WDZ28_03300 [Simkaniaceae bacterium]